MNNDLHRYTIEKSGDRSIRLFFDTCGGYTGQLFDLAAVDTEKEQEMSSQHRRILQAILEKDWKTAEKTLIEHIQDQKPIILQLAAEYARRPLDPDPTPTPIPDTDDESDGGKETVIEDGSHMPVAGRQ